MFKRILTKAVGGAIGSGGIGFLYMLFFVPAGPDVGGVLMMAGIGAVIFGLVALQ